jgi:hypothetical protein
MNVDDAMLDHVSKLLNELEDDLGLDKTETVESQRQTPTINRQRRTDFAEKQGKNISIK